MDTGKNDRGQEERRRGARRGRVGEALRGLRERFAARRSDRLAPVVDLLALAVALLFSGCHLIFGSYPLAIALLAALPDRVWIALLGAVAGSLFLGKAGIVYAMIAVLTVFLRVVISGGEERTGGVFREPLMLRVSCAVIGGFVGAVYEVLLNRLTLATLAFGLSMILLPGALVLLFFGLFGCGILPRDLLFGKRDLFAAREGDRRRRLSLLYFRISAAGFLFFVTYALDRVSLFGIHFSYVFAAAATLFLAKRFGPLYAAVGGFVSAVGLSASYAVSFALGGIAAGLLFPLGALYALIGGGAALCAWSSYAAGLTGLLSTLPEYLLGACAVYPLLGKLRREKTEARADSAGHSATDMVGTMALAYQTRKTERLAAFERSLADLSPLVRDFGERDRAAAGEGYRRLCAECAEQFCRICPGYEGCRAAGASPCGRSAARLSEKLARGEQIGAEDIDDAPPFCKMTGRIAESICRTAALFDAGRSDARRLDLFAQDCELFAKMLADVRAEDARACAMDGEASERLEAVFAEHGFDDGVIRAFGGRQKYVLAAGEDEDGSKICSPALKSAIEAALNVRLGGQSFYRRDKMVVMEAGAEPVYDVSFGTAAAPGGEEISGDSAACFVGENKKFYAVLSDGMGSGEIAAEVSGFAVGFLRQILPTDVSASDALRLLNRILRRRFEECGATVDLFEFDLLTGEALFIKSGAAPSYVKRRNSLFRIRSETLPLGLLEKIDSECIRTEVCAGDRVILASDGVVQSEDAPRLVELLNRQTAKAPPEYAAHILAAAQKSAAQTPAARDDMTVVVLQIEKL